MFCNPLGYRSSARAHIVPQSNPNQNRHAGKFDAIGRGVVLHLRAGAIAGYRGRVLIY